MVVGLTPSLIENPMVGIRTMSGRYLISWQYLRKSILAAGLIAQRISTESVLL